MSGSDGEFKHESFQDSETIVRYLNAISEGFQKGKLVLANGDSPIELEPTGLLKMDLKARRKDGRMKLSVKISWKEKTETVDTNARPLVISPSRD